MFDEAQLKQNKIINVGDGIVSLLDWLGISKPP